MMKRILILLIILSPLFTKAQFPGTDSLRNYNNKFITNNPATAFTNLRLNTLLRGIIDWVDTARAGTGGGGALGIDTLWALNDSTIRYRKNGVFRTFSLKGVYDSRRKVDTAYAVNDTTLRITINGSVKNIIIPGRGGGTQNISNASLTANGDYTQNWGQHILAFDDVYAFKVEKNSHDAIFPAYNFYNFIRMDSTINQYPFRAHWSLGYTDNSPDSIWGDIASTKTGTGIYNVGASGYGLWDFVGNSANPRLSGTLFGNSKLSNYQFGHVTQLKPADSIQLKAIPAATADSIYAPRSFTNGVNTLVKIPSRSIGTRFGIEDNAGIQDRYIDMQAHHLYVDNADLAQINVINGGVYNSMTIGSAVGFSAYDGGFNNHNIFVFPYMLDVATGYANKPAKFHLRYSDSLKIASPTTIAAWHNDTLKAISIAALSTLVGSGTTLSNVGSGYRLVKTPSGQIKTTFAGYGIIKDSTTNTDGITDRIDTSSTNHIVTQSDLNDVAATKLTISDTTNKWVNDVRRRQGTDTVEKFKNGSWQFAYKDSVGSGGGSSQILRLDLPALSETKIYSPAQGIASSHNVTNYSHTSVDSAKYKFSTTRAGSAGSEYGGWLFSGTSGDSIRVTAPYWVIFGDSQAEGHPGRHGRLHPNAASFDPNYQDLAGQMSYHLRYLTNMRWYNHGIGGQTSVDCRIRFARDVLGITSANSNDNRGNTTLSRKPQGVVIIVGINDIFNGIPAQTTKDNLEWMASMCQQYGIRCVILNIPGDATSSQANLQGIASMNVWMASGVFDQYGACVVDYNTWWNDPAYGNDNIHPTALIVDDIHPTMAGYDSLATYIYQKAKLPKLTKMVFINQLDPAGFTGYSRPAGITINSVPYTISSANDTINIISYVPDSVWIKVTSSTNVTGTTNCGFEHIESYTTNNPLDTAYYTKRTLYSGSQKASMNVSDITLVSPTLVNGHDIIKTYLGDMTNIGLTVRHYAGTARMMLNGQTILNSAAFSINGGGNSLSTDGNILSAGTRSQFNVLEINQNHNADNTGFGITAANTTSSLSLQGSGQAGKDLVEVTTWNGGRSNLGTNPTNLLAIRSGFGSTTDINQVGHGISLTPSINNTAGDAGGEITGIYYRPTILSLTNTRHVGIYQASGNNYFNVGGNDSTCFGCDSASIINAKFRVKGSTRFDLGSDANYDVFYRNSAGLFTRLAAGTDGKVLTTHSTSSAPTWETASGGGTLQDAITAGATLSSANTIASGSNAQTFTGTQAAGDAYTFSNTGNGGAVATSTSGSGIAFKANNTGSGTAIFGQAGGSGTGGYFTSVNGLPIYGQANPSSTNSVVNTLMTARATSSTAAAGLGNSWDMQLEDDAGTLLTTLSKRSVLTSAATGAVSADYQIHTITGGSLTQKFTIKPTGQVQFNSYGSGTFTGTPTASIQTTSAGNLIEGPLVAAGTYTPTATNTVNVTSSTPTQCQYSRVGNVVTVSGRIFIDYTSSGYKEVMLTLPFASNFANDYEAAGTIITDENIGDAGTIKADVTNDKVTIGISSSSSAGYNFSFTFTYQVL